MSEPQQPHPTLSHVSAAVKLDRICDEFEQTWRREAASGNRPRIEAFVEQVQPSQRQNLLCELLAIELEVRQRTGDFLRAEEYYSRFPESRDQVESIFRRVAKSRRLGDYELRKVLGQGGMGVVYQARQVNLNQMVALKVLPERYLDEPQAIARFKREMQSIGALEHPNIVRAYYAGEANGTHFLAMEYVDGIDLQRLVKPADAAQRPLSVGAACEVIRQAALGLQHAHKHGIVHRDVKPANLMLGRTGIVKLLDLGLAKLHAGRPSREQQSDELTQTGITMGTVNYMAPEQWENSGGVDIRADIYSLGCTLFFLLAAKTPYGHKSDKSSRKKLMAHLLDPIPSLVEACPDCPRELEKVFDRMLAKAPEDRFQTPREVVEALEPFADERELARVAAAVDLRDESSAESEPAIKSSEIETDRSRPPPGRSSKEVPSRRGQPRPWYLRPLLLASIAAAAVVVLVAGIAVWQWHWGPQPSQAKTGGAVGVDDSKQASSQAALAGLDHSHTQHQNNLLLLPGLNGNWWFDEMPWYTPFVRQAVADAIARSDNSPLLLRAKPDFYFDPNTTAVQERLWNVVRMCRDSLSQPQKQLLDALKEISDSGLPDPALAERFEQVIKKFDADHAGTQWPAVDRHTLACLQHKLSAIRLNSTRSGGSNHERAKEAKKNYDEAFQQYPGSCPLRRLCRADSALLCSELLDDYCRKGESRADDGKNRFREAIDGDNIPPLFKAATLITQGGEASDHADTNEYDSQPFDAADHILRPVEGHEESPFAKHPLTAIARTSRAWSLMDQWKVDEARNAFSSAYSTLDTNRASNPALSIEYFHTLHGLAIASRYQGNLIGVQSTFLRLVGEKTIGHGNSKGEIQTAIDSVDPNLVGRQRYIRDLTERWANSAERWADCQLYGGAASGRVASLDSHQACKLYNRARCMVPDPGNRVVMTCKYCILRALSGGTVDAARTFATDVAPVKDEDIVGSDRERAALARQLAMAVLMFKDQNRTSNGMQALRDFLRQFHTSNYYDANRRETLEMRLFAAELLLNAEIRAADIKAAHDDLRYLDRLLEAFKPHEKMQRFLRRYYELAVRAVGKDQLSQMAEYLLAARASKQDFPSPETTRVVFHLAANDEQDSNENYAVVVAPGNSAKLVPLNFTRKEVQQAHSRGNKLELPGELLKMIDDEQKAGRNTMISWEDADCFFGLTEGLTKAHWSPFDRQLDYDTLRRPSDIAPMSSTSAVGK